MDEDCLATPGPTTSMFLNWINTNRMGTARTTFCSNVFMLKKHSLKITFSYMLDRNLKKRGHDNFSKHFSIQKQIYLTVLEKEQHKKVRVTLKKTYLATTFF